MRSHVTEIKGCTFLFVKKPDECAEIKCQPWETEEMTRAWLSGCEWAALHYQSADQLQTGRGRKMRPSFRSLLNFLLQNVNFSIAQLVFAHTSFLFLTTALRLQTAGDTWVKWRINWLLFYYDIFSEILKQPIKTGRTKTLWFQSEAQTKAFLTFKPYLCAEPGYILCLLGALTI